jgi:hypothetical protein
VGTGWEYQSAPGVFAGTFDPGVHRFHDQTYSEILADMTAAIERLRQVNPAIRLLLTVSPVPLTATASDRHVLVANTHSKSVLRAVAGELAATYAFCDYFPSYEIITGSPFRSAFYDANLRTVSKGGVDTVMEHFFHCIGHALQAPSAPAAPLEEASPDPLCDDAALERFAKA